MLARQLGRKKILINGVYRVRLEDGFLGAGGFGHVYVTSHKETKELLAMKLEHLGYIQDMEDIPDRSKLPVEYKVYTALRGAVGFPRLRWYGTQCLQPYQRFSVLVMDMLGPSLSDVFVYCGKQLSLKSVLMIAEQVLTRIECVHGHLFLHRDLKPRNMVMGKGRNSNMIHFVDFGLSKKYGSLRKGVVRHVPEGMECSFIGTTYTASLNVHKGTLLSRRDDLESLAYTLMFLLRGSLPWRDNPEIEGLRGDSSYYDKVGDMKEAVTPEMLCKGYPEEFGSFLKYCRDLEYKEKPDYQYLRQMFRNLFYSHNFQYDNVYDWNKKHESGDVPASFVMLRKLPPGAVPQELLNVKSDTEDAPANVKGSEEIPRDPQAVKPDPDKQAVPQETPAVPQETPAVPQETPPVPQDTQTVPQETPPVPQDTQAVPQETPEVPQETPEVPQETETQAVPQDQNDVEMSEIDAPKTDFPDSGVTVEQKPVLHTPTKRKLETCHDDSDLEIKKKRKVEEAATVIKDDS